ncbi:MAG: protein-ADP-ribose hydrolase [bacterium]|nr:protein-ADP-ribose hydrolase [bacterium]
MIYTEKLLETLIEDSVQYKDIAIPSKETDKKHLIRSLMNVRMPREASDQLLDLQNDYLQEELLKKGIVTLWEIPTVKEQYGSQFSNADKISLWQGDITRLKVDAVVNAANSQMLGCFVPCHGCIDNAIHSAAGIQLRTECNHIMNQRRIRYGEQYEEPTGTATLTKAYNLPCKYVIHTVGPIVYGELNEELRQELRNCYENVLKCCVENEIKSVAFCCISTGEFHFPNDEAAKIALNTVTDFLKMNDGMERVIFNVFKDSDKEIYQKIFGLN